MYDVKQYPVIIRLYFTGVTGKELIKQYQDYSEFLLDVFPGWVENNIANKRKERKYVDINLFDLHYSYIVETEFGEMIKRDRILKDLTKGRRYITPYEKQNSIFRKTEVPFTGKRSGYRYYRHPKTTVERRQYFKDMYDLDEYYFKVRSRRGFRALPNSWDDQVRHVERNWKSQRNHQWK